MQADPEDRQTTGPLDTSSPLVWIGASVALAAGLLLWYLTAGEPEPPPAAPNTVVKVKQELAPPPEPELPPAPDIPTPPAPESPLPTPSEPPANLETSDAELQVVERHHASDFDIVETIEETVEEKGN